MLCDLIKWFVHFYHLCAAGGPGSGVSKAPHCNDAEIMACDVDGRAAVDKVALHLRLGHDQMCALSEHGEVLRLGSLQELYRTFERC